MSEETMYTKDGTKMNLEIRNRLIDILINPMNDGFTQQEVADMAKVSLKTVWRYLTPEVWESIRKLRLDVLSRSLAQVDRAIFAKAVQGDLAAAKLIYNRWDESKEGVQLNNLETVGDVDEEIRKLRSEIKQYERGTGV